MADTKISELAAADTLDGSELVPIVQDSSTVAATLDDIAALSGTPVWADYTPALTASSSNPTMGSGSVAVGRYVQDGETISGWARIVFGTGMAAGSGTYRISLPVAPKTETVERVVGSTFHWIGTGGSVPAGAAAIPASATYVALRAGGIHVDSGAGWVATGEINISFTYEAA